MELLHYLFKFIDTNQKWIFKSQINNNYEFKYNPVNTPQMKNVIESLTVGRYLGTFVIVFFL